ncbi:hypothetical protein CRENBAI_010487, partial [Crenichthys baileyi]
MGQTKSGSRILHEDKYIEARDVARYGSDGVPPWSQAWGRDSSESAWWPGCSSRDPAGPSLNERREAIPQWAHHLQGEPSRKLGFLGPLPPGEWSMGGWEREGVQAGYSGGPQFFLEELPPEFPPPRG